MADGTNERLLDEVATLLDGEDDILLAIAFGSAAAGTLRPDSDIDIAVFARAPLTSLRRHALVELLAGIAGRPVDLVDLRSAGVVVTSRALQGGKRLVCKDRRVLGELVSRSLADAADFLPYHQRILDERRRAWTR